MLKQSELNSNAEGNCGSRGLTIWSITLNTGHDCFYYTKGLLFPSLVLYAHINTQRLEHGLMAFAVRYNNSLVCKQITTVFPLDLVSVQPVNVPL